ncbi:MAG: 2-oxoglutarate and iron-dependent oxygenase domain-containing protein [Thermodesulfobacteriota bacterium]
MQQAVGDSFHGLPVIDVSALVGGGARRFEVAAAIAQACRDVGFFYVVGHGVDAGLQDELVDASRRFFARPLEEKLEISMARGGRAWRGYFPVGAELTSGRPDAKEGIYFGSELPDAHPLVAAGTPLHGANLWPSGLPELRSAVLAYLDALTGLGHALLRGVALGLELEESYLEERYTKDPLVLFRIFNYPALPATSRDASRGVGEHTDYGLLTVLKQDESGGLEVESRDGWVEARPIPGSFVCNIGDMLDRMTRGRYRSTPHRVRNRAAHDRLSFPFFFDPGWHAEVRPIETCRGDPPRNDARWDGADVHVLDGTYGEYVLRKIAKVFPALSGALTPER